MVRATITPLVRSLGTGMMQAAIEPRRGLVEDDELTLARLDREGARPRDRFDDIALQPGGVDHDPRLDRARRGGQAPGLAVEVAAGHGCSRAGPRRPCAMACSA